MHHFKHENYIIKIIFLNVYILLSAWTDYPPLFLVPGMVTGAQCSWHAGRNKLKVGTKNIKLSLKQQGTSAPRRES